MRNTEEHTTGKSSVMDHRWLNNTGLIQRWSPYFNPYQNQLGRVATWIRIPHFPLYCYNSHSIARLGDRMGRALKVDMNTLANFNQKNSKVERGKYARTCVELNLQKQLVSKVIAAGTAYNIEYEGLSLICFACGRFGHQKEACPYKCNSTTQNFKGAKQNPIGLTSVRPSKNKKSEEEGQFGALMMNPRSNKTRFPRKEDHKRSQSADGKSDISLKKGTTFGQKSRFAVIEDFEEDEEREEQAISGTEVEEVRVGRGKTSQKALFGRNKLTLGSEKAVGSRKGGAFV